MRRQLPKAQSGAPPKVLFTCVQARGERSEASRPGTAGRRAPGKRPLSAELRMTGKRFRISNPYQRNPPNGKRVTRPYRWGNPFRIGIEASDAAEAVAMFRDHLHRHPELVEEARRKLAGFDLGCFCPLDQPCHADVWLEVLASPLEMQVIDQLPEVD